MQESFPNHYERAFENWLIDNQVRYISLDKHNALKLEHSGIKTFDFFLHLPNDKKVIAEVKGRKFKGVSLENMASLECWVTTDDIDGLLKWREILGSDHQIIFVFCYKIDNIDVDFDGKDVFEFESNRYVFFGINFDDYRRFMKQRSPKWRTVTLPAGKFRQCVFQLSDLLY